MLDVTIAEQIAQSRDNIDYYPTNFVPCGEMLYYIDYECNTYMEQWDFEHWGMQYWTAQTPERTEET